MHNLQIHGLAFRHGKVSAPAISVERSAFFLLWCLYRISVWTGLLPLSIGSSNISLWPEWMKLINLSSILVGWHLWSIGILVPLLSTLYQDSRSYSLEEKEPKETVHVLYGYFSSSLCLDCCFLLDFEFASCVPYYQLSTDCKVTATLGRWFIVCWSQAWIKERSDLVGNVPRVPLSQCNRNSSGGYKSHFIFFQCIWIQDIETNSVISLKLELRTEIHCCSICNILQKWRNDPNQT